jgi:ribosome-associated heat shock protein Hsp15
MTAEKIRIDKYLWAIRLFKTRTQAADAIHAGKVKLHGADIKASHAVAVGEEYEIKTEARKWLIRVTGLLEKRVQYPEAIKYYEDLTPHEEILPHLKSSFVDYTGKRQSKQGRPTKRNRRELGEYFDM